jgi:hypothetical protein
MEWDMDLGTGWHKGFHTELPDLDKHMEFHKVFRMEFRRGWNKVLHMEWRKVLRQL